MARLPTPGGDQGSWGQILNDFLLVAHNPDGTSKLAEIVADKYIKPVGGIPESDLSGAVQTKLNSVAGTPDHGDLSGLSDDDHLQYHNNARGDARYYTQIQLNNGQLDGRYYTESEVDAALAGKSNTGHTHTKADVGLGNVDNTSDANKPVSSAAQQALDEKADTDDLAAVAFSGDYDDLTNKPAGGAIAASGNVLTYANPTSQSFLRINIQKDASPTGDWPDRLVFYHNEDGTYRRTGSFNEFGEIRSDASRWNRTAMRAHGFGTAGTQMTNPQSADIFQVSLYRSGPVLFGVGRLAITAAVPIQAPNIGIPIKAVLDHDEEPDDPQPGDIYLIRPE